MMNSTAPFAPFTVRRFPMPAVIPAMPASLEFSAATPPLLPHAAALFLDFDGTLTEMAARPEAVSVSPGLLALLTALNERQHGALAILTGRRLMHLDALLAPVKLPGAGVHGAELRLNANDPPLLRQVPGVARVAAALRTHFEGDERLLIEDKGAAVALHFRLAPERGVECIEMMHRLATGTDLNIIVGRMVVEARPVDVHKGVALSRLLRAASFAGRMPVFVGDDRTDEDGFITVNALGGYGVKVGQGATAARYRLQSVGEVYNWLRACL